MGPELLPPVLLEVLPGALLGLAIFLAWGPMGRRRPTWELRRRGGAGRIRGVAGGGAPWRGRRRGGPLRRRSPPEVSVTEAMELIALAIATGSAVVPAVEGVAEVLGGRRGTELARVAAALAWGYDDRAWEAAGAEWEPVHRALALAQRAGVPPADLLTTAAADLRRDRASRLETAAARLGVRLVLPLGLLFLPAFILTTVLPLVLALATGVLLSP